MSEARGVKFLDLSNYCGRPYDVCLKLCAMV